ncbi:glycosyltransferase family 2 protein [candidate division KSB1 bacterium]|nr:glycosyltransferase family 2 protein [candidate division KSB1 bacterium]
MTKVAVLIPAFNVRNHLAKLLQELTIRHPDMPVVVVDDGSSDGTYESIQNAFSKVTILRHQQNCGKGAALKTGIAHICKHISAEAVIFMDGDGQHPVDALSGFIKLFKDTQATFIIGKRKFSASVMPLPRIASNTLTSKIVSLKIGTKVCDSQSGYRLIERKLLEKLLPLTANRYNLETEILIKAGKAGAIIKEIDIPTIYAHEKSNIRPITDIVRFLRTYFTT